jgi:hypothetical protein
MVLAVFGADSFQLGVRYWWWWWWCNLPKTPMVRTGFVDIILAVLRFDDREGRQF